MTTIFNDKQPDINWAFTEKLTEEEFNEHIEIGFDGQEDPDYLYNFKGCTFEQWDNDMGVGIIRLTDNNGNVGYCWYE